VAVTANSLLLPAVWQSIGAFRQEAYPGPWQIDRLGGEMRWFFYLLIIFVAVGAAGWYSGSTAPIDEIAIAEQRTGVDLDSQIVDLGGIKLHVVSAGPEDGPAVVLLHGFPEFWFSWHQVIKPMADAGYRVLVPDLRGYNRSSKPADIQAYSMDDFGGDIIALLDTLGIESAYLAGHDVGGGVAWWLTFEHAERFEKAIVFATAHPLAWRDAPPEEDNESISWFRDFFKLPFLPELVSRSGNWYLLSRNLQETSAPGTFSDEEIDIYRAAWARDNAISTMINSYRATHLPADMPSDGQPIVPVKYYFGEKETFIPRAAALATANYIGEANVIEMPGVSHWIMVEEPEATAQAMLDFFN